jgi:hypothetical protein
LRVEYTPELRRGKDEELERIKKNCSHAVGGKERSGLFEFWRRMAGWLLKKER